MPYVLGSQVPKSKYGLVSPASESQGSTLEVSRREPMKNKKERPLGAKIILYILFPVWIQPNSWTQEENRAVMRTLLQAWLCPLQELRRCGQSLWAAWKHIPPAQCTVGKDALILGWPAVTNPCSRPAATASPDLREQNEEDWELFTHT